MSIINSFKKLAKVRFAVGMILVGLIVSIIAGIVAFTPDNKTYETVEATIISMESHGTGDDIETDVYVEYEVDGKSYNEALSAYDSTWKIGDKIEVKYDAENPSNISYGNTKMMSIIICVVGIGAFGFGVFYLIKGLKTPAEEFSQYDRVKEIDTEKAEEIKNSNEQNEEFVFHFTGKLNQSFVMKNRFDEPVYEAICGGVKLAKDTEYEFKDCITGLSSTKKISHTITDSYGNGGFRMAVKSSFKIDGKSCWDVLADMGYGFDFSMNGAKAHYEVRHHGINIGFAELGGTGLMNKKYANNPLGKVPTNGIFKVSCPRTEIEGMFLICFCITRTEETMS